VGGGLALVHAGDLHADHIAHAIELDVDAGGDCPATLTLSVGLAALDIQYVSLGVVLEPPE
jgi:hypothetical protein